MATATASAGAMSVRASAKDAAKGAITAVSGRSVRTVKTATHAPTAHPENIGENKGRRAANVPGARTAHPLNGPIRGNNVPRNTYARLHLTQERLIRGKAITSASAAVAAAATAANGVNAREIRRRRRGARKSALQQGPPRSKGRHRRCLPHQSS